MSTGLQFFVSTLVIYAGVDIMACWGLNLQFGVGGILSFAFIVFQAAGAYTAAVLTLGPASRGGAQEYFGGNHLPFPLPILAAGIVGALLAVLIGLPVLGRLRRDYQAIVMLAASLAATLVVSNDVGLFNGSTGLALIPKPLAKAFRMSPYGIHYQWFFAGLTVGVCLIVYLGVHRITSSPLGRSVRAMRDNEDAAAALGKNVFWLRMFIFAVGGAVAAVSGAILVEQISAWSPSSWMYVETFSYFAAVIIGGAGNNGGAVLGAILVPVVFLEAVQFIPQIGGPELVGSLQWILIGLLLLAFLWWRPRGLLPERVRHFR